MWAEKTSESPSGVCERPEYENLIQNTQDPQAGLKVHHETMTVKTPQECPPFEAGLNTGSTFQTTYCTLMLKSLRPGAKY